MTIWRPPSSLPVVARSRPEWAENGGGDGDKSRLLEIKIWLIYNFALLREENRVWNSHLKQTWQQRTSFEENFFPWMVLSRLRTIFSFINCGKEWRIFLCLKRKWRRPVILRNNIFMSLVLWTRVCFIFFIVNWLVCLTKKRLLI